MNALQKALEIKPESFEAITYINLLYREKAKVETDPVKAQEYTGQREQVSGPGPGAPEEAGSRREGRPHANSGTGARSHGVWKGREGSPCLKTA